MEVVLSKVSKSYGPFEALKPLDFTFTAGVYGLLGPNGAGKSTLMNMLATNLRPTTGVILCDGEDIQGLGEAYRRRIGYMPQQQGMYDSFSARRFLYYIATLKGIDAKTAKRFVHRMLKVVGLSDRADDRLGGFSGGMKQRILIAAALLGDPDLLILDEPTAGLDPKERIRIRNLISEIAGTRIVLIATHVVSDIEQIAKQIVVLSKGVVLAADRPESLLANLAGMVREADVTPDEYDWLKDNALISNVMYGPSGLRVRLIDFQNENLPSQPVYPTLEDVYLYYFSENL